MALVKGALRCFEWLRTKSAGDIVSIEELMDASGWSEVSVKTYLGKNKLSPFLVPLPGRSLKVMLGGSELSGRYFDEVFTQTAPPKLSLAAGDKLTGEKHSYKLVEPLGAGAIGHVWSAQADSRAGENLVAVKVMLPRADLLADSKIVDVRERFRREARNGGNLKHPHLVAYLDLGELHGNPFLVMELGRVSVGKMLKDNGAIAGEKTAVIVDAVLDGLDHLHSKMCPHRDVKPDNILAFNDGFKLADLGIVKWSDFDPRFTTGGTLTKESMQLGSWFYMAPEQQQSPHEAVPVSDVYALGVTWIEMLTGELPSPQAVGAGRYPRPCDDDEVCSLLRRMVAYSPHDRPTLTEIKKVVQRLSV